jgi:hypothetical protein
MLGFTGISGSTGTRISARYHPTLLQDHRPGHSQDMADLTGSARAEPPQHADLLTELLTATAQGIPIEDYLGLRAAGVSHWEATEAHRRRLQTQPYLSALRAGATHNECIEFATVPSALISYANYRSRGYRHQELLDVRGTGVSVELYDTARAAGTSHEQFMEVIVGCQSQAPSRQAPWPPEPSIQSQSRNSSSPLDRYVALRQAGRGHAEAKSSALRALRQRQWPHSSRAASARGW